MIRVSAREICQITGATLVAGPQDREIAGVAIDSRGVPEGGMFVAFPGERVDGNDFVTAAIKAGAAAVAMSRTPDADVLAAADAHDAVVLTIQDAEAFLQALASWWRGQLDAVVVGVTGSSGKTTTRNMIAAVLATELRTHTATGNHNNLIGCPLTILSCPADAQALVVEMGMSALGEIATLARIARPDLAVITNVGVAHIGDLGSRENIARAKSEIITGLVPSAESGRVRSRVFLWGEDAFTGWMRTEVAAPRGVDVVTYGTRADDDCRATDVRVDDLGRARGTVTLPSGATTSMSLRIAGRHNALNALAAAAVGDAVGISPAHIAEGLAAAEGFRMHQQVLRTKGGVTLIDDSYNANPDSMRRAIDQLADTSATRRVACLGDMAGLGEDGDLQHAAIGGYAAGKGIDVLVCVGPASRHLAQAAVTVGMAPASVVAVDDPQAAVTALQGILRPGDALLVIASHCTGLERVVEGVLASGGAEAC